jgi:PAS domain S-box-containing protein
LNIGGIPPESLLELDNHVRVITQEGHLPEPDTKSLYHQMFLASPDPLLIVDAGVCRDANPAALALVGYSRAALLGMPVTDLVHPASSRVGDPSQEGDAGAWQRELDLRRSDGTLAACDVRGVPLPGGEGQEAWFIRDLTDQRRELAKREQREQELRASDARYRGLLEHVPAAVYLLEASEDATRLYYSPYMKELSGYDPAELLGDASLHWLDFVHPDDREWVAALNDTAAWDEPFRAEYRIVRADGRSIWVRDDCVPVYDEAGTLVAWQGVMLDISDRIAAEADQARLAAIVESAEDAIISTQQGIITSWNRGAERMFGYRADEAIGQYIGMILPEGRPDDAMLQPVRDGTSTATMEGPQRRRDGTLFDASASLSPIRDRHGAVIGVSSITTDVTARNRADEALRDALETAQAATRSKSQVLAMMSHDLRTPLQAVLGYADFLLSDAGDPLTPLQREDIGYIHQGAQRMVTLIEQLLDLSRMEAGRLDLARDPVDLPGIIEQVRQDVAPQAGARDLTLTIDLPKRLPHALGDAGRVRQILLNLAGNAVKFTEQGGVQIHAQTKGDGVEITVCDSGIGIAPEALASIFEEFHQVDGNLTRRRGGAGLGLAISKRLAEQMGGSVGVTSEPGAGSAFTLWLPAAPKDATRENPGDDVR